MNTPAKYLLPALLVACLGNAGAMTFTNVPGHGFSVQTPRGSFECRRDDTTQGRQILSLSGHELYRQDNAEHQPEETDLLRDGIVHAAGGCPKVLASKEGFVIMVRQEPPTEGARHGYLLVDFNEDDPVLVNLGTGQSPQDDTFTESQRLIWEAGGLILNYVGYTPDDDPAAKAAATPQTTLFSFAGKYAQDGRQCLRLKGFPLFGDNLEQILKADPAAILPGGLKLGMPKADAVATLRKLGEPYNPDDSEDTNLLTLPLCGDANDLATPLFQFRDGRLASMEFEGAE